MIESGADKLRELLNKTFTPQKDFTETNIKFQEPVEEVSADYNTTVDVKGVVGKGYYGTVSIKYKRVDLADLGTQVEIRSEKQLQPQDFCDLINSIADAFISVEDLQPFTIPTLEVGVVKAPVTIRANPGSVAWTGEVVILVTFGRSYLKDILARNTLQAITPPGERYDAPAAWALLFYQDFTSFREALKIDPKTRTYVDGLAIQAITSKLGIPNWALANPVDYPTSAVSNSNQNFDRVVVQTYTGTGMMYGPIYFHYNTTKFDGV